MHRFRVFIAALLLAAWLPALNWCALASTFPEVLVDCCQPQAALDHPPGAEDDGCGTCVTLENGFRLTHLDVIALGAPSLVEDAWLTALFGVWAPVVDVPPPVFGAHSPPPPAQLWHFLGRTAVPVRGPSFAA